MISTSQPKYLSPFSYGLFFGVLCGALSSLPIGLIPLDYLAKDVRFWIMFGICLLCGIIGGVRLHLGLIR